MADKLTTILLVDDHELILQEIKRIINTIPVLASVDAVTSGLRAAELISLCKYDIYVLDVELPDMDSFALVEQIRKKNENAYIIMNTMHEEIWILNRLMRCGVDSIILKSSEAEEIKNAIQSGLEGKPYYCARFKEVYDKLHKSDDMSDLSNSVPTPREMEVLHAIASGYNTLQIAKKLNISKNTVETFRKHLILKFNATNSVDLVIKAIDKGLIPVGVSK